MIVEHPGASCTIRLRETGRRASARTPRRHVGYLIVDQRGLDGIFSAAPSAPNQFAPRQTLDLAGGFDLPLLGAAGGLFLAFLADAGFACRYTAAALFLYVVSPFWFMDHPRAGRTKSSLLDVHYSPCFGAELALANAADRAESLSHSRRVGESSRSFVEPGPYGCRSMNRSSCSPRSRSLALLDRRGLCSRSACRAARFRGGSVISLSWVAGPRRSRLRQCGLTLGMAAYHRLSFRICNCGCSLVVWLGRDPRAYPALGYRP